MSSIVKQIFLLAVFVMLQSANTGQVIVTGPPLPPDGSVPYRENIRDVENDPKKKNCLLLGFECMQNTPPNDPLSWRSICAIHGTNLQWNNDNNGRTSNGYCQHGTTVFPTWHRPYLALFEQALYACIISAIEQFPPGSEKDQQMDVCRRFRLPYWDFAENAAPPEILGTTAASQTVTVRRMQDRELRYVDIPNPCSRYRVQISGDSIISIGSRTEETVRYGRREGGVYRTNVGSFATNIDNGDSGWRRSVRAMFEGARTYTEMASSRGGFNSVESPHNSVHTTAGGSTGHMSSVRYAGFDPLFWFHHCNVDRLVALYQACYPDRYFTAGVNDDLRPFRAPTGGYWNSATCRYTQALNYRYAEAENQAICIDTVRRLYTANVGGRRKRNLDTTNRVNTEEVSDNLVRVARARDGANGTADSCESHDEYHARITISNGAADGSSTVYLFMCEPYADEDNYATDPCLVGSLGVFSSSGLPKSHRRLYRGIVDLTEALEDRYAAGELKNMKSKTVKDYLKDRLIWKIVGKQTPDCDLDGFDIHVVKIRVDVPNNRYKLPSWKETTELCKVV